MNWLLIRIAAVASAPSANSIYASLWHLLVSFCLGACLNGNGSATGSKFSKCSLINLSSRREARGLHLPSESIKFRLFMSIHEHSRRSMKSEMTTPTRNLCSKGAVLPSATNKIKQIATLYGDYCEVRVVLHWKAKSEETCWPCGEATWKCLPAPHVYTVNGLHVSSRWSWTDEVCKKKIVLQRSLCADLRSGCSTTCLYLPHPAKWFALTNANLHWHCAKIAEATGDHTHSRCWPPQTFKAFPFRAKHVLRLCTTLHHARERSVIFWDVTNWSRTVWPNHRHETPSRPAFYHCVYRATACSLGRSIQFIGFLGLLERWKVMMGYAKCSHVPKNIKKVNMGSVTKWCKYTV